MQNKGFSLLETLLAVSILAIGLTGILQAYAGSLGTLEVGQYYIDAVNVAKIKMSDLEQEILEDGKLTGLSRGELNEFQWDWNTQDLKVEEIEDLEGFKEVTLSVSHKDSSRSVSLVAYYVEKEE